MERKNKFALIFFAVMIIAAIGIKLNNKFNPPRPEVFIGGKPYPVLVAKTFNEQYKGLGDRDGLDGYIGMYFDFIDKGQYGIVMRGMRFPLDVLWLDGDTVVHIEKNLPLQPGAAEESLKNYINLDNDANAVLELSAGTVDKLGIKEGDSVIFCEDAGKCRR